MVERVLARDEILAQIGANNPPRAGTALVLDGAVKATVLERCAELYRLRFEQCDDVFGLLEQHGKVPLPLYIARNAWNTMRTLPDCICARTGCRGGTDSRAALR